MVDQRMITVRSRAVAIAEHGAPDGRPLLLFTARRPAGSDTSSPMPRPASAESG